MILRRLPDSRFSEVLPVWAGETAVLIGGGDSLTLEQIALVRSAHAAGQVRVVAINDAYLRAEFADVNYFADSEWWGWHNAGIRKDLLKLSAEQVRDRFASFAGQKCSIKNSGAHIADDAVHILRNAHVDGNGNGIHGAGLSSDRGALATGRNSGFQGMNMLTLAAIAQVIMIGFDAKEPDGPNWKSHWHGDHPRIEPVQVYSEYRQSWSAIERPLKQMGVRVINCSPGSAIAAFEKMTLEQALA